MAFVQKAFPTHFYVSIVFNHSKLKMACNQIIEEIITRSLSNRSSWVTEKQTIFLQCLHRASGSLWDVSHHWFSTNRAGLLFSAVTKAHNHKFMSPTVTGTNASYLVALNNNVRLPFHWTAPRGLSAVYKYQHSIPRYLPSSALSERTSDRAKAFTATEAACQITAISFQDGLKHQSSVTA